MKALARRIARLEAAQAADPFADMSHEQLRSYVEGELERLAAELGNYDALAEAFRQRGLDAASKMIDRMNAAKQAGETETHPDGTWPRTALAARP
jgi:hypothetical protein